MADSPSASSIVEDVTRQVCPNLYREGEWQNRRAASAQRKGSEAHVAKVIHALLAGPVGDVLRAALRAEAEIDDAGDDLALASKRAARHGVHVSAKARNLPSDLTDMLGGKS